MIIDAHTHVDESVVFGWIDPPETILELMAEAGIDRAVIMTYADVPGLNPDAVQYIADVVKRFPDKFYGFARLNPIGPDVEKILEEAILDLGLKGLKLHTESITTHPHADATVRLVHKAASLGAPVLFHSGDEYLSLPLQIGVLAEQCPEATIILAHTGGYYHYEDAINLAARYENVYIDTSAIPYPEKIKEAVARVGAEKLLFGSDGPGCNPKLELVKIGGIGLSEKESRLIQEENILRILERVKNKR